MNPDDEAALIALAKDGNQDAFARLMEHYEPVIHAFIYRIMGDSDDARDLTQDTFLKAFRALCLTKGDMNLNAWLHQIAKNACLDVLRRRQRLRWQPWEGPKHDHLMAANYRDEPESAVEISEARREVRRTLDCMATRHRTALVLREYHGLSCYEIGEIMGLSRTAVKSMLFRAREEFRRVYWGAVAIEEEHHARV